MRKLVTIRTVDNIFEIKGADRIELAQIGGWGCIVKKDEFSIGDKGLFFEIDSWIPATDERFNFLGSTKDYMGKQGWRIKTMKMRKTLSQGLLLPLSTFPELDTSLEDHAETLGVLKWDDSHIKKSSGNSMLAGTKSGKFPSFISKTDQERLQNLSHYFKLHKNTYFEETLKLDGSSITAYRIKVVLPFYKRIINYLVPNLFKTSKFGVCSRNIELQSADNYTKTFINDGKSSEYKQSNFWSTALKYNLDKLVPEGYAIQAELIGPRIQSNHEKVNDLELYIYDIFDIQNQCYLTPDERLYMMSGSLQSVPHVTIISKSIQIFNTCTDFDIFQERVTGESFNSGTISEGRVYKSIDGLTTFKLISNKYLLKEN